MTSEIDQKLDNFKKFVKEVSRNTKTVNEYEGLSWFKVQALAYVLLIPQRDNLPTVAAEMQKKLDFDDEHLEKFIRYLDFFVEYLTGTPSNASLPPKEPDAPGQLSYQEHLEKIMAMHDAI
jgi:hypothetical protein